MEPIFEIGSLNMLNVKLKFCYHEIRRDIFQGFHNINFSSGLKITILKQISFSTVIGMLTSFEYAVNMICFLSKLTFRVFHFKKRGKISTAFCSSLLRAIIAHNHLLFFKFQSLYISAEIFKYFTLFLPFFALSLTHHTHALTF